MISTISQNLNEIHSQIGHRDRGPFDKDRLLAPVAEIVPICLLSVYMGSKKYLIYYCYSIVIFTAYSKNAIS